MTWSGEGAVGVELDSGHVDASVAYKAQADVEDGAEPLHCPWLAVDVYVDLGGIVVDLLVEGVPPDPTGEVIPPECYEVFGELAPVERPGQDPGSD